MTAGTWVLAAGVAGGLAIAASTVFLAQEDPVVPPDVIVPGEAAQSCSTCDARHKGLSERRETMEKLNARE